MALSVLTTPRFDFEPRIGGGGKLAFGQAVNAIVFNDIDHVDAAADGVRELAEADRGGIAVAGNAEIDQIAVGEIGAGQAPTACAHARN